MKKGSNENGFFTGLLSFRKDLVFSLVFGAIIMVFVGLCFADVFEVSFTGKVISDRDDIYYNDGYVGIGTTSPGAVLDVGGDIRAEEICDEDGGNCKDVSEGWDADVVESGLTGCPSGTSLVPVDNTNGHSAFCIETDARPANLYYIAIAVCGAQRKGDLCTPGQIYQAYDAGVGDLEKDGYEWSSKVVFYSDGSVNIITPDPSAEYMISWSPANGDTSLPYRCCL